MDVVIFRENTEDVYIGIEWKSGSPEAKKLLDFLNNEMLKGGKKQIRVGFRCGHQADFANRHEAVGASCDSSTLWRHKRKSVTLVHKGNIQKFTEGGFRDWGYELAAGGVSRADDDGTRELDRRQFGQESVAQRGAECRDD